MSKYLNIYLLAFLLIVFGCNEENELEQSPLNSFSMNIDDQPWQPSIIENDPCFSTFHCEWSAIDQVPFYTIKAYKDSKSRTDHMSQNFFRIQIMDIDSIGLYNISDPHGDFNSYAMFINNESGTQEIYENSATENTSIVEIEEIIPIKGSDLNGIKGSFNGILYNKNNPNDSIVIDNCKFNFKKINWRNFCQCAE